MAKQKGFLKVVGTLGDTSFVKTSDGYLAKTKSETSAATRASSRAFDRVRENASEFGRAGRGGKLVRTAIRTLLQYGKDRRVTSRLTAEMIKVVKSDAVNPRGQRTLTAGNKALLEGFEFNNGATLSTTLMAVYTPEIVRADGKLRINIQPFTPSEDLAAPGGSSHFQIVSAGAEVDFEADKFQVDTVKSAVFPINEVQVPAMVLGSSLPANSTLPLFLVVGIQFFQQVNGVNYPLKNGAHNALRLVMVSNA